MTAPAGALCGPGSDLRRVWLIEIHPGERLVYAANRVGTERGFRIDFDLSSAVLEPKAAL